jgi:hypothetical protein
VSDNESASPPTQEVESVSSKIQHLQVNEWAGSNIYCVHNSGPVWYNSLWAILWERCNSWWSSPVFIWLF